MPRCRSLSLPEDEQLPSDLQPFFIVRTEELKGLVDLHVLSPVLPNVELYIKDGKSTEV